MKQHPILFSTDMVQAILDGSKTMTRRIVKPQPEFSELMNEFIITSGASNKHLKYLVNHKDVQNACPYGKVGDVLWVRETLYQDGEYGVMYVSDNSYLDDSILHDFNVRTDKNGIYKFCKIPNIFMPRSLTRIWLEITSIRVERLQDITEDDAKAEGVLISKSGKKYLNYLDRAYGSTQFIFNERTAKGSFKSLWKFINKCMNWEQESWESNPWVWVISFKKISMP